jgi:hypothetical protein
MGVGGNGESTMPSQSCAGCSLTPGRLQQLQISSGSFVSMLASCGWMCYLTDRTQSLELDMVCLQMVTANARLSAYANTVTECKISA